MTAQSQVPSYTPGNPTKASGLAPVGFQLGSNPPSTIAVQMPIFSVANENIGIYVRTNTAYPCYTGITLPQQTSFSQFQWQDGSVQALNQGMQGPRFITCQAPVFTQLTNPMYMHGTAPTFQTGNQAAASVQNIPQRPTFVLTPLPASQLGNNHFLPYCANETNNQTPATYFTPGSFQSQYSSTPFKFIHQSTTATTYNKSNVNWTTIFHVKSNSDCKQPCTNANPESNPICTTATSLFPGCKF